MGTTTTFQKAIGVVHRNGWDEYVFQCCDCGKELKGYLKKTVKGHVRCNACKQKYASTYVDNTYWNKGYNQALIDLEEKYKAEVKEYAEHGDNLNTDAWLIDYLTYNKVDRNTQRGKE